MNETLNSSAVGGGLVGALAAMRDKGKPPHSVRVLNSWIDRTANELKIDKGGRLAWLVASTVVTAKLQCVIDSRGDSRFLMKGGTLLQHRLGLEARATVDLDGMIRGDLDNFLAALDVALEEPWGPISFARTDTEEIRVPGKAHRPRKFDMVLSIRGVVWRKIKVEISPEEGRAACSGEVFPAPRLEGFGIPTPDKLMGMAMSYQAAQKLHGAAGLHDPEHGYKNLRARDVVDLILIKRLSDETGHPSRFSIREAAEDTFQVRGIEAEAAGRVPLVWPPKLQAYSHWKHDFEVAAQAAGLELTLKEAVAAVNGWIAELAEAAEGD